MITRWIEITGGDGFSAHLCCDVVALDDINADLIDLRKAVFNQKKAIVRSHVRNPLAGELWLYFRGKSGSFCRLDQRVVDEFPIEGKANRDKRHGQDEAHAIPMCAITNKREWKVST
mmetsp:Transcript_37873/g.108196  ORF Transcript_37873/g.108196 Transcript_37873/m.108196 type:complete len:117 (-) Transcript_37873:666-1016(-)